MDLKLSRGQTLGKPIFALGLVAVTVGAGWLWSRWREQPLAERTRARLAPRQAEPNEPSAAEIVIGFE